MVDRTVRQSERLEDRTTLGEEVQQRRKRFKHQARHMSVDELGLNHTLHLGVGVILETVKPPDAIKQPV